MDDLFRRYILDCLYWMMDAACERVRRAESTGLHGKNISALDVLAVVMYCMRENSGIQILRRKVYGWWWCIGHELDGGVLDVGSAVILVGLNLTSKEFVVCAHNYYIITIFRTCSYIYSVA